jgi:glutaconate CoA-transferase subunit B
MSKNYKITELMACIIARELKNNDKVAIGLYGEFMLAAAFLAQKLYSPKLKIRHGLNIKKGIELNPAAWTLNTNTKADKLAEYKDKHDSILTIIDKQKRFCDTFFVSGIQIDKFGNTNLIGIKDEGGKLKIRGPGSIGISSITQFAKKYYIFTLEHSKRKLVEKVDYISSIGYNIRKRYKIKNGPKLCITPLCIFDFKDGLMRLKSIHPHSSLDEIKQKTGFKFIIPKNIAITKEPTKQELKFLRSIDRNKEFEKLEKQIVY